MVVTAGGIGEWASGLDHVVTIVGVGHVAVPVVRRPLARPTGKGEVGRRGEGVCASAGREESGRAVHLMKER